MELERLVTASGPGPTAREPGAPPWAEVNVDLPAQDLPAQDITIVCSAAAWTAALHIAVYICGSRYEQR